MPHLLLLKKEDMYNTRKIIKRSLLILVSMVALIVAFGFWFMSLISSDNLMMSNIEDTLPKSLTYLSQDSVAYRGKILAVVTSTSTMGASGKKTGYELTELARAYYVFTANGFEVDIASPLGGTPPIIIDKEDMSKYDYAFMNDPVAQSKALNTIAVKEAIGNDYEAIYFVGGKGAMFDFPYDTMVQSLVSQHYESRKLIGAVCHGPAALVNVTLSNGTLLLSKKKVSGFTNNEEIFLIPDPLEIFPFMLQSKMQEQGAIFEEGDMYLENVVVDNRIITGQNPWSTWKLAESMVHQLGYKPKPRNKTAEEHSVVILQAYEDLGYTGAKKVLTKMLESRKIIKKDLIAMHSIVAVMQGKMIKAFHIIRLLAHTQN